MPIDMLHYATEANRVRAIDSDYVRKLVTNAEITIKNKAFTKFPTATGKLMVMRRLNCWRPVQYTLR